MVWLASSGALLQAHGNSSPDVDACRAGYSVAYGMVPDTAATAVTGYGYGVTLLDQLGRARFCCLRAILRLPRP